MVVLRKVGKVILATALGYAALMLAHMLLGMAFGFLQGLFGWPMPSFAVRNLILLAFCILAFIIYRNKRRRKAQNLTPSA